MSQSLFGLFKYLADNEADVLSFRDLFCYVGNSLLTTIIVCFIARWVFLILIDIAKRGGKY